MEDIEHPKQNFKRIYLLFGMIGVFALGFMTHALFFPDVLSNGVVVIPKDILSEEITPTLDKHELFTDITFDGEKFSRSNVTIGVSDYVTVTNTSKDKLMWLTSNVKELSTVRGYGESEQVKVRLDQKGQYFVKDKENPDNIIVITVR